MLLAESFEHLHKYDFNNHLEYIFLDRRDTFTEINENLSFSIDIEI